MNTNTILSSLLAYNWTRTDSDANQYCAELDPYTYVFVESCGGNLYRNTIDIRECFASAAKTKDTEIILRMFGYDTIKEMEKAHGELWAQVLAKCIFEFGTLSQDTIFTGTEDECDAIIAKIAKSSMEISA